MCIRDTPTPAAGTPSAIVGAPGVANAAAVVASGRVVTVYRKIHLPNYAVFDEERYFTPGDHVEVLEWGGERLSVNVCEDIWNPGGPTEAAALAGGARLVVNISMSPYHIGKGGEREQMLRRRAVDAGAFVVYVNGVGGQDELVFDGHSVVAGPDGSLLARGAQFEEELIIVDLDLAAAQASKSRSASAGRYRLETVRIDAAASAPPAASASASPAAPPAAGHS